MTARRLAGSAGLLLAIGLALVAALYLPGLSGPWLLDDFHNLAPFNGHAAGAAPYAQIITSNDSGPLGRPVAMASFAANHALNLYATPALKATNLALHLVNGLLVFLLLRALFARRPPATSLRPETLAALLAVAWLLLPLHVSAVLYIVQRMTVLATTFSLLALLAFVHGRSALAAGACAAPRRAILLLAIALPTCLGLALFTKESGATTLASLVLIELFFFRPALARPALATLVALVALALLLVAATAPAGLTGGYVNREFSLDERLLTQPRVLWLYLQGIFLPGPANLGLVHDHLAISRTLLQPATTLPALLGIALLAGLAVAAAASSRLWPLAFGAAFFLAGHLLESTVLPLELYFEHRNYLPALGLLLAAAAVLSALPLRPRLRGLVTLLWLLFLCASTAQRAATWGDEGRLLAATLRHHPQSLTAATHWGEYVFARDPAQGLAAAAAAATAAPANADVLGLQMVSMYCRLGLAPPAALIGQTADALARPRRATRSVRIGLDEILARKRAGHCGNADFSPLLPALRAYETTLLARHGPGLTAAWETRYSLAAWLLELGQPDEAVAILDDIWSHGRLARPFVGLELARALAARHDRAGLARVLGQVEAIAADAPPSFRTELDTLNQLTKPRHD